MAHAQTPPQPAPSDPPPAPPDPPEVPDGVERCPRWPAWYAPAGFFLALALGQIAGEFVVLVLRVAGVRFDLAPPPAGFALAQTVIGDSALVVAAVALAARTRRPRAWQFGLRPTALGPAVGWAALGLGVFYGFSILYLALLHP